MVVIPFKAKEIKEENIWFTDESIAKGWVVIAIYREDKSTVCVLGLPEKETDSQEQIENQPEEESITEDSENGKHYESDEKSVKKAKDCPTYGESHECYRQFSCRELPTTNSEKIIKLIRNYGAFANFLSLVVIFFFLIIKFIWI
jgi:hypothetical protein